MEIEQRIDEIKTWLGAGSINIFGVPYAGKDTQGAYLAEAFDGTLLGGGQILRSSVMSDEVKAILDEGGLIPTADYMRMVLPYLRQPEFADRPLILSAVGRWHGEEPGVVEATAAADHALRAVIYITLDEPQVIQRWEAAQQLEDRGQRTDDQSVDIIRRRLQEFEDKTMPVIDFYRDAGLLVEIDGNQSPQAVSAAILDALTKIARQSL